jgi:Domain of Unknown Function (DUF1259)
MRALVPPGPTGMANAINFQPTGGGKAAITRDFLVTGDEVNPLIRTLRANGIEVTAIHSHMSARRAAVFSWKSRPFEVRATKPARMTKSPKRSPLWRSLA